MMRSSLRRGALVALAVGAASAAPAGAACKDALFECREGAAITPAEVKALVTTVPVKGAEQLARYRDMLPPGFEMPARPTIGLKAYDIHALTSVPVAEEAAGTGYGTRWIEASVDMRVKRRGVEGWYGVAIATNGRYAYSGRSSGYPKYWAQGTAGPTADGWRGVSSVDGKPTIDLRWTPGTKGRSTELLERYLRLEDANFYVNPVHEGPETHALQLAILPFAPVEWLAGTPLPEPLAVEGLTRTTKPRLGRVAYVLDPDLDRYDDNSDIALPNILGPGGRLDGVIDVDDARTGYFWDVRFNLFSQDRDVTEDGG